MSLDAQSNAYRNAGIDDLTDDAQLSMMIDNGELVMPDDEPVRGPEFYEYREWDADREGPKTRAEARAALTRRIESGSGEAQPFAYDELGD